MLVWGSATGASVLDTRLDGHGVVGAGLVVLQPNGFVARRIVARRFLSYGVEVDPNDYSFTARSPYSLRDLTISQVSRQVPGSSNGTAEACLWLGSRGRVQRVSVRRCAVSGIWTGDAMKRSRVEDATIQDASVGIYIEHFTTSSTFERLRIGPGVTRGVNAEWDNPAYGGKPASIDNVIEGARIQTVHVGVYLDQGTTWTTVRTACSSGRTGPQLSTTRESTTATTTTTSRGSIRARCPSRSTTTRRVPTPDRRHRPRARSFISSKASACTSADRSQVGGRSAGRASSHLLIPRSVDGRARSPLITSARRPAPEREETCSGSTRRTGTISWKRPMRGERPLSPLARSAPGGA